MSFKRQKIAVLIWAKLFGLFALARFITRKRLRILAYHGLALDDEYKFRPMLFISAEKFEKRLQFLQTAGYPVLGLDSALAQLKNQSMPDCATVLTIDDGWYGTSAVMGPLLNTFNFPATLYVSSYYSQKETQVFNIAIGYFLWKTKNKKIDLCQLRIGLSGVERLECAGDFERVASVICERASKLPSAKSRQELLSKIANVLNLDYKGMLEKRMFFYAGASDLADLEALGVDLQLHTHRHRFSTCTRQESEEEISENRKFLKEISSRKKIHFCYPSGQFEDEQLLILRSLGVVSATTCRAGLASRETNPLLLPRILDSEDLSAIEFEAEMSGFKDLARTALAALRFKSLNKHSRFCADQAGDSPLVD